MNDNTKNQTREQDKATGRPWSLNEPIKTEIVSGYGSTDICIAQNVREANAALIVKAVNSHDALVEALEELLHGEPDRRAYEQAEAVLKAAKGEA